MKKVRLIEVRVQPIFVLDDGEHLTSVEHPVTVIPAVEWPTYSSVRFPREVKEWQKKLNEPEPPPNRAERRRAARAKPKG